MAKVICNDFDFDVQLILKKMIKLANERWKNRCWHINSVFWNDTDYELDLVSTWGDKRHSITYRKATNKFFHTEESLEDVTKHTSEWHLTKREEIK